MGYPARFEGKCLLCCILQLFRNSISGYSVSLPVVREPAVGLMKWLRTKGLKVCSYVEKYAEFKNQTLKKVR